jgi:hypothetical protein
MNKYFRSFELLSKLLVTETRWRSGLTFGQDVRYYVMNWFSPVYFPFGVIACLRRIYRVVLGAEVVEVPHHL